MLSVENVSAGYGKISVLSEISIRLESNSILGVLGRNGMGKSTLIKVLSGQGRGIFPRLKVVENLMLGKLLQTTVKKDRLDEVYSYFPILSERTGQVAGTLSGGEQQMLAIGRAIMSDPKIMLLDEPSDGIMPSLVKEIGTTLKSMSQKNNISLVVVEQNVPLIFSLTDRCIILEKGKIVVEGKKSEIQDSNIMKQYLAI